MINQNSAPLAIIVGPTAAGKSAIALELARESKRAIISADSRQIYRDFDIGTAKPSEHEQRLVKHYGIGIVDATERYSAHAWAGDAARWMAEAARGGQQSLIVGGTGFYIRAFVSPLAEAPSIDADRRRQLEEWFKGQETEKLRNWCARLDPTRAHLGRTQILRAVETALLTGQRLGDAHQQQERREVQDAKPRAVRYLVVDPGPPLAERIRARVGAMVDAGWADEVRTLMERVPRDAPGWLASGYGVMRQHVLGELKKEEAIELIVIETRQYAKRQRTWFRHQLADGEVTRISSIEPNAMDQARAWLSAVENVAS